MLRVSISLEGSTIGECCFSDDESIVTIGRASDNDILLPDPAKKVSRHHAVLIKPSNLTESHFVRDLGSRYGVGVRERLMRCAHLGNGETFTIADYTLRLNTDHRTAHVDRLRIVSKQRPEHLYDASTMGLERDSKLSWVANTARQVELRAEIGQFRAFENPCDCAGALMPALCAAVQASKGFVRLFRHGRERPYIDIGIAGMQEADAIEIADSNFLRHLKKGSAFVEADVVLSPVMSSTDVIGFIAVGKSAGSIPFSSDDVDFLVEIGKLLGDQFSADCLEGRANGSTEAFHWPEILIGNSEGIKKVRQQIAIVAKSTDNVLIVGETGTGKELVAREIHRKSGRTGEFVEQNAAQLTESLAESVVFGYVAKSGIAGADIKGAPGWFELANRGTLFLDEVHGLNTVLQDKFLRALQEKKVSRIGAREPKVVDVKVIAATDFDLERAIDNGVLRRAFYFRFEERICVPPLRERKQDIPVLAYYFLDNLPAEPNIVPRCISHKAMDCLLRYDWPGNVRELQSCIKNAARTGTDVIFTWNLPDHIQKPAIKAVAAALDNTVTPISSSRPRVQTLTDLERDKILETLEVTHGNKTQSSQLLGITRMTLLNKMDKFGIPRNYGEILNRA
ncbi:MAG: sigma 54-interacting transcriptional regulator [Bryobacteraceae bacterium]